MEELADEEAGPVAITLRWGRGQVDLVKRAAALMGVPYQTYLKQVVFRQALADIEQARAALGAPGERESRARRKD
jgi:predicted DNA binding CopG/RHH family protein